MAWYPCSIQRRRVVVAPLVTLLLIAAACGGGGQSGEGETQFGAERAVAIDGGVCSLLTTGEVEALTGRDMESGRPTVGSNCDWKLSDNDLGDGVGVTVEVDPLFAYGGSPEAYEAFLSDGFGTLIPIPELGENAWATVPTEVSDDVNSIAVARGENAVALSALFLDAAPNSPEFDVMVETMRLVLTRLDDKLPG